MASREITDTRIQSLGLVVLDDPSDGPIYGDVVDDLNQFLPIDPASETWRDIGHASIVALRALHHDNCRGLTVVGLKFVKLLDNDSLPHLYHGRTEQDMQTWAENFVAKAGRGDFPPTILTHRVGEDGRGFRIPWHGDMASYNPRTGGDILLQRMIVDAITYARSKRREFNLSGDKSLERVAFESYHTAKANLILAISRSLVKLFVGYLLGPHKHLTPTQVRFGMPDNRARGSSAALWEGTLFNGIVRFFHHKEHPFGNNQAGVAYLCDIKQEFKCRRITTKWLQQFSDGSIAPPPKGEGKKYKQAAFQDQFPLSMIDFRANNPARLDGGGITPARQTSRSISNVSSTQDEPLSGAVHQQQDIRPRLHLTTSSRDRQRHGTGSTTFELSARSEITQLDAVYTQRHELHDHARSERAELSAGTYGNRRPVELEAGRTPATTDVRRPPQRPSARNAAYPSSPLSSIQRTPPGYYQRGSDERSPVAVDSTSRSPFASRESEDPRRYRSSQRRQSPLGGRASAQPRRKGSDSSTQTIFRHGEIPDSAKAY